MLACCSFSTCLVTESLRDLQGRPPTGGERDECGQGGDHWGELPDSALQGPAPQQRPFKE